MKGAATIVLGVAVCSVVAVGVVVGVGAALTFDLLLRLVPRP